VKILVVDDEAISLSSLGDTVSMLGHEPVLCGSAEHALELCRETFFPVIVTDIRMPGMDGLELLERIKETPATAESDVIMVTGHGDVETAIQALRSGAYDFLRKPLDAREFIAVVERSAEHQSLRQENIERTYHCDKRIEEATEDLRREVDGMRRMLRQVAGVGDVVAVSSSMQEVLRNTRLYHENHDVTVLIEGETGTGKEIVARCIHFGEEAATTPFVDINCSVISENLFESELFGYESGAFTGSHRAGAKGKLEAAGDGTVFLDEIGDLPLHFQPKLLRVLQERTFYRVGGIKKRELRARIVCATNQDLAEMVEQGLFRRDLYHRLKIGYIHIPPLRERREDILPLAELFLGQQAQLKGRAFQRLSRGGAELLRGQEWKGNVRELKNAIERALLMHDGPELLPEHLEFLHGGGAAARPMPLALPDLAGLQLPDEGLNLDDYLHALKREIVLQAVARFDGNKSKAAEFLGWDRNKIYRLLDQ